MENRNKLEEVRKISADLKLKGINAIDIMAVEYASTQEEFDNIVRAYYRADDMPIKKLIERLFNGDEKLNSKERKYLVDQLVAKKKLDMSDLTMDFIIEIIRKLRLMKVED